MDDGLWTWRIREDGLILKRLREHWKNFCAVAEGDEDESVLPDWDGSSRQEPEPTQDPPPYGGHGEDVPF